MLRFKRQMERLSKIGLHYGLEEIQILRTSGKGTKTNRRSIPSEV